MYLREFCGIMYTKMLCQFQSLVPDIFYVARCMFYVVFYDMLFVFYIFNPTDNLCNAE